MHTRTAIHRHSLGGVTSRRRGFEIGIECLLVSTRPISRLRFDLSSYLRLPVTEDAETAAGAMETGRRRTLGMTMPTIDYIAFRRLETRSAAANDRDVIRVAREAMTAPTMKRLKIRNVRKTAQATVVDKVLRNKVR